MRTIDQLLSKYGESHQNATNKLIHWVCVPAIMFSLLGLLMSMPWPFGERSLVMNWAGIFMFLVLIYYARLSIQMFFGFMVIGGLLLYGNFQLYTILDSSASSLALYALLIFVLAWIGQFIGHKIEGKKPSFLEDLQFLLIGPAWLLHFVFNKLGVKY